MIQLYKLVIIGILFLSTVNFSYMVSLLDETENESGGGGDYTAVAFGTVGSITTGTAMYESSRSSSTMQEANTPRSLQDKVDNKEQQVSNNVLGPHQNRIKNGYGNGETPQRATVEKYFPELLQTFESMIDDNVDSPTTASIELSNVIQRQSQSQQRQQEQSTPQNITLTPTSTPSITLVTQGNVSKFPRLLYLLQRWDGPISCAFYITTLDELYSFTNYIQDQTNNTSFHKHVSVHLLFEPSLALFYPINTIRNLALRNAKEDLQSQYVFLNDIDLIPSHHSHDKIVTLILNQPTKSIPEKTFWILPAFERFSVDQSISNEVNDLALVPENKTALMYALQEEQVAPFHSYDPGQHGPTNYGKWYATTTTTTAKSATTTTTIGENGIYSVEYKFRFEPYGIVRSQDIHEYFPKFRGYGQNKVTFFLEAFYRGYQFQVIPDIFVVHMNHEFYDGRDRKKDGNSDFVYPQFQTYLEETYHVPITSTKEKELKKTSFRTRDKDLNTTAFPCHYLSKRMEEFKILPHYNQQQRLNTFSKWLPTSASSKYDITIVTMMHPSSSMFNRLIATASNWSGLISVAVFIHSNDLDVKQKAKSEIKKFQTKHKSLLGNRVSFHLVIDMVESRGQDVNVFPRNLLRNVAMDNVHTDYILVLDMDLIPSLNAHDTLKNQLQVLDERNNDSYKYALVVPAFEKSQKYGKEYKETASTKSKLLEMMKDVPKSYGVFLNSSKVQAHNATNSEKWYKSTDLYEVKYEVDYEPYVVVRKDITLPPFWEHFTGFGRNKLEWIEELHLAKFKFVVAPDSFVVHQNHKKYGLRYLRPYVVYEYARRFQAYVDKVYGQRTQDANSIIEWESQKYKKWKEKVDYKEKIGYLSGQHTVESSKRRDNEFEICMNRLNLARIKH